MLGPQGKTPPKTGPATLTRIIIVRMLVPKMVRNGFIPLLGFGGGFEAHVLLAFTATS
jgi:hypothetical protein